MRSKETITFVATETVLGKDACPDVKPAAGLHFRLKLAFSLEVNRCMTHNWQMHCGGERLVVMGVACVANHAHSDKALWVGFMLAWANLSRFAVI